MGRLFNVDSSLSGKSNNPVQNKIITNNFTNIIRGNKSGKSIILDDQYPVEHKLNVKVSNVIDFSKTKLFKYGANVFNLNGDIGPGGQSGYKILSDSSIYVYMKAGDTSTWRSKNFKLPEWLEGHTITISGKWSTSSTNTGGLRVAWIDNIGYTMNNIVESTPWVSTSGQSVSIVVPQKPQGAVALALLVYSNGTHKVPYEPTPQYYNVTYTDIQISIGDIQVPYEPYVEPEEYTIKTDGTVDNIIAHYPVTGLITNDKNAIIDCKYNMDTTKAFNKLEQTIISLGGII